MVAYEVMVEGVFVGVAGKHGARYGFHSTFFLTANNAPNAAHRVSFLVRDRLEAHGIRQIDVGLFKSYFCIHDTWEIANDRLRKNQGKDSGFTFFRIGRIGSLYLYFRRWFLVGFRPWLMVPVEPRTGRGSLAEGP